MTQDSGIKSKMQAEQAFQMIARHCLDRYRRYLPELRQSWDAEALHQARVGLRQLLAAFALFRPMIEGARFRGLHERVKSTARVLGEARRRREKLIEALKRVQDALGELNDVNTERDLARDFVREGRAVAYATGKLIGAEETRTAPLPRQAAKAARKLRKKKPFWR